LVARVLPCPRCSKTREAFSSTVSMVAGFLAISVAGDHRDVDAHQWTHVTVAFTIAAENLDHLPAGTERDRDLADARVLRARIGVDGLEQLHLGLEAGRGERIFGVMEADIGAHGRLGVAAGITAFYRADGIRGARERGFGHVRGMGIADRLVLDGAQPESLVGIVGRLLEPPVVEHQHFGLGIFEIKLAIVGTLEPTAKVSADPLRVEAGALEKRHDRSGHDGTRREEPLADPKIVSRSPGCEVAAAETVRM